MPATPKAAIFLLAGSLAGCAGVIGPDFSAPDAPDVSGYSADALPGQTAAAAAAGGQAQTFQISANVPERWWTLFGSAALNRLVDQALAANPNLASAQQSLIQAQENYAASQAGLLFPRIQTPSVQAAVSDQTPFAITTQGQLSVAYSIEICCGSARSSESAEASLKRQEVSLYASYVALTANVVNAVINIALIEERLGGTDDVLQVQEELIEISRQRLALGDISASELATQEEQLLNTQQSLISLNRQHDQQINQLAIYLGKFPSEMGPIGIDLDDLRLPTDIPVSLPSQLVAQRPDIVQAAYRLHSATADVGVTLANMLPQVSLSASFTPAGFAWDLMGNIVQAAVNVGANIHRRAAAEAALEAAAESYRSTVISAFVDVANTLQAVGYDADLMALAVGAETASLRNLELTRQQYDLGTIPYSNVLSAEQSYGNSVINVLAARADRLSATVALYVALGGGWWANAQTVAAAN